MELDHFAVAGETLEAAVDHVEAALGVAMQPGGRHARFGTWNRLLGLADGLYLEAIAIDPVAPSPGRPRWFELDRFRGAPRLSNWICRVGDLDAALAGLPAGAGDPVDLERGALSWRMAVPASGVLPFDDRFPALIQWRGDLHPAAMLAPSGCALGRLIVTHPRADELAALCGQMQGVVFEPGVSGLRAEIETPHGTRLLE
ncbi:VOC family protein [Ruegeria marina]|uniref:Glyoxalase-like domain-containing protein n=1 Tax=Ruegeria marina TaxID=639004 RepID=A0A1G6KY67_9RHOB|nr:VOC family protein [Ruegeria marina]SDC36052.1 Glyoxalase-like domain-containing protein [Ruegeria marina]